MRHRFLFVAVLTTLALEGGQSVGYSADNTPARTRDARHAMDSLEAHAAARVVPALCNKRIAVLGELPEHGEARGFGIKARVVEGLVTRCGFRAVLFEAGSYDFFGLERSITNAGKTAARQNDSLELAFARAMGGFWWTRELAEWRRWVVRETVGGRKPISVGGIDDQISATAAYAKSTLPGMLSAAVPPARAAECREAVARYVSYSYTTARPYDDAERARLTECARLASDRDARRTAPEHRTQNQVMLRDLVTFFARERKNADSSAPAAPDRDLVMAEHVTWWLTHLPRDAKVVVWTATTHATRAAGSNPVLPMGVRPLGARLAERWGDEVGVIGFSALGGQWSRAGRPSQPLAPLPSDALEARALAGRAPSDTLRWAFVDHEALQSLGAVPSRLFGKVTTTDWSTAFDGVVVVREETAPTFEPRR
jgi:erythromycin esterase-like protein